MQSLKIKIKRDDTVRILKGKDRGKTGKVVAVFPRDQRLLVEGVNMIKKHVRARRAGQKGQRVSLSAPLPVANVQLLCSQCKKGTRVGIVRDEQGMHRVCKKCKSEI